MIHTHEYGPEYTPEEWDKLQVAIESSGGAILQDPCTGEPITFKAKKGGRKTTTTTCHCDNQSMAVITYDVPSGMIKAIKERGGGFARVCLVCDAVGQWPNFIEHMDPPEPDDPMDEIEEEQ
jgi:hypothetical protein